MKLRTVCIQLRMHRIHLHVEFPCLITYALKVGKQEIESAQSIKLEAGKAIFSSGLHLETQIPYDHLTHQYNQKRASIIIYILSQAIGKNIAGICHFEWTDALESHTPCSFARHFERCPDKEALVEFTIKAHFLNHMSIVQLTPDSNTYRKTINVMEQRERRKTQQCLSLDKRLRSKSRSVIREDHLTSRVTARSPRELNKSICTPMTSRVEQTVRKSDEEGHKIQVLKFEILQKDKSIKRLEVESHNLKYEAIGLRQELQKYKSKGRPRQISVSKQNQRLKNMCRSLEETIDDLKLSKIHHQKDSTPIRQNKQSSLIEEYKLKNKHLEEEVVYYKKSKESVENIMKDHLRTCKHQMNQYNDLKQEMSLMQIKLEAKQKLFKEDQKQHRQKMNEMERQKYKAALEIQHLKSKLQEKEIKFKSVSADKNKLASNEKQKLMKKNDQLKHELRILTKFKDSYCAEIESFNLLISNLNIQNQHLTSQISFLKEENKRLKSTIEDNLEQLIKQEASNKSIHREIANLKHSFTLSQANCKKLQIQNSVIHKDFETSKLDQAELSQQLDGLRTKCQQQEIKLYKLQNEYETVQQKQMVTNSSKETILMQKEQLAFLNNQLNGQICSLKAQYQQKKFIFEQQILKLKYECQQNLSKNRKLNESYQYMKYQRQSEILQNKSVKQEVVEHQQKQRAMVNKLNKYQQLMNEYRRNLFSKEQIQIELNNKIVHLEKDNKLKNNMIDELNYDKESMQRRFDNIEKELKELQYQYEDKQKQIRKTSNLLHQKNMENSRLVSKIQDLEISLIGDNAKISEIQRQTKSSYQKKERQKANAQMIKKLNQDLSISIDKLQKSLESANEQTKAKQIQIQQHIEQNQKMKRQLKTKSREFDEFRRSWIKSFQLFSSNIIEERYLPNSTSDTELTKIENKILQYLKRNKQENQNKIKQSQKADSHNHQNILLIQNQNKNLTNTLKSVKQQNNNIKEQLENAHKAYKKQIQQLKQTIQEDKYELNNQQHKVNALIKEKETIKKQLDLEKSKIEFYLSKIKQIQQQYQSQKIAHTKDIITLSAPHNPNSNNENNEFKLIEQVIKGKQKQNDLLIQTINTLKNRLNQQQRQKIRFTKQIEDFKHTNQKLQQSLYEVSGKVIRMQSQLTANKFHLEYLDSKNHQLESEIRISEEKRFILIKDKQIVAQKLKDLQINQTIVNSRYDDHINNVTNEIDKLRNERKELDTRYFMIRKQSFQKYKNLQVKEIDISKKLNLLKEKEQAIESKIKQYNHLKYQTQNATTSQNQDESPENNELQSEISILNKQIGLLKQQLYEGKQQFKGQQQLLSSLQSQLQLNKQLLTKALQDLSMKQKKINAFSNNQLEESQKEIQIKQQIIKGLKKRVETIENQKFLQDERFTNIKMSFEATIQSLKQKIDQLVHNQSQISLIARNKLNKEQINIRNLEKEKEELYVLYNKQRQQNKKLQQQNFKRFQTYINTLLDQKEKLHSDYQQAKDRNQSINQYLQRKCASLEKQLSESNRQLNLLRNNQIPTLQSSTYFMKSINQYEQVNKQMIDKFRDFQKSMELTQSQKIKIINKLREFVLILLRCKTKNLERGADVKEISVIVDEYKLLQQKINYLVEYSFTVFEVDVPVQFESEINQSIEDYMMEIANLKEHRQEILGLNPAEKFKRVQRSLSLIGDKDK